jgi:hypothetical protein
VTPPNGLTTSALVSKCENEHMTERKTAILVFEKLFSLKLGALGNHRSKKQQKSRVLSSPLHATHIAFAHY